LHALPRLGPERFPYAPAPDGPLPADPPGGHRGPSPPHHLQAGGAHPRHLPRGRPRGGARRRRGGGGGVSYLLAFLVGGGLTALGQLLIDGTKLTNAHMMVVLVASGALIHCWGLQQPPL